MSLPKTLGTLTQGLLIGLVVATTVVVLLLQGDNSGLDFRYVGF